MSKIDNISSALLLIGHDTINSLNDPGYPSRVAVNTYDAIVQAEITKSNWTFARRKVQLAQLTTDPVDEFDNAFQVPSDSLKILFIKPRSRYKIYGNQLYTNISGAVFLDYIANVGEDEWPPSFTLLIQYALATNWAIPIKEGLNTMDALRTKYVELARVARADDSSQNPQDRIASSPFVQARLGNGNVWGA